MLKPLMCPPELLLLDLTGKTYVVTGAGSGLGAVTSRQLAKQGAKVVLACRSVNKGQEVARAIREEQPLADIEVSELDLGNLASVRSFAHRFLTDHSELHGLVNNAGVMNTPQGTTADGFELQFGTNHLGHFLLTDLLLDILRQSAPSRIVILSSAYHDLAMGRPGDIHFEDIHFERRKYDGWQAYAQSKLANVLHARELGRRLAGSGVTAVSVHPGWVRTELIRNVMPVWLQNSILRPLMRLAGMLEPWEGSQTTLYALLSPDVVAHPGAYFSQVGAYRDKGANKGGWPMRSPNPNAHDELKARRLWELSERLTSLDVNADAQ